MNYRHAFHAGNFADVFKHTILIGLLEALRAKPGAFCYVDTHAGRGLYDLRGDEATRTGESDEGIDRLLAADDLPAALRDYVERVRAGGAEDGDGELVAYPGSPLLARPLLREQDRAILCELQPEEAAALRTALRGDPRMAVHQRDGYAALKALLPPPQKRGLVLVDPPFEAQGGEYTAIQKALEEAFRRWPNAIYAIWYPIKKRETIVPFHRWLRNAPGDVLVAELLIHPDHSPLRLNGCGMAMVNTPWQFDQSIEAWLPTAKYLLTTDDGGEARLDWLRRS